MTDELAARHDGPLVVVFEEALGNELVQVTQSRLVLHQNDKVAAREVFQLVLAVGGRGQHRIDIRRGDSVHLVFQACQQLDEDAAQHGGILAGAVVLERAHLELLCQQIELEFIQVRQHQAAHLQRVDAGELPLDGKPSHRGTQKAHIEARVVRHERILSLPCPFKEIGNGGIDVGRIRDGFVRNTGQLGDFRRNRLVRIDIGLERVAYLALHDTHSGDLGYLFAGRVEAGGFQVEHDECTVKRLIALAAHDRDTVRIVDVVRLDTVNDLHIADDALLLALLRVQRFRERLCNAVVGDGHRAVSPLGGAAQQRSGGAHAVHRAHVGVQVQLDALHALVGVLSLGLFGLDDAGRLEHHLLGERVVHHLALHGAVQAALDLGGGVARLIRREELGNAHGIGAVGHVERDLDVILAGLFAVDVLVVGEEHLALNRHHVIRGNGLVDRNDRVLYQLAEDEVVLAHLFRARALIAHARLCRSRARLLGLGRFRRGGCRLLDRLVEDLLAGFLLPRRGREILRCGTHRVYRTVPSELPPDAGLQMAQRVREVLLADLVHRDLERTVRKFPLGMIEQTSGRRHPRRHIVVQRLDIGVRELTRHFVARLYHHTVKAIGVSNLLFGLVQHLAAHDLVQTELDHHHGVVIPKGERTHLACGKVLLVFYAFAVLKNINQLSSHIYSP